MPPSSNPPSRRRAAASKQHSQAGANRQESLIYEQASTAFASENELPPFDPSGIAAVRLLQGVIYDDDSAAWNALLQHAAELAIMLARLGLLLIVDRTDGFAYLKQIDPQDRTDGYERLPVLFRRTTLTYEQTLLSVLLRDHYRRFEEEDLDNGRCIVETDLLFDSWKSFFSAADDEVRLRRRLETSLKRLAELRFVKPFATSPDAWEVRRILKARLPLEDLEQLRDRLLAVQEQEQEPDVDSAETPPGPPPSESPPSRDEPQ